MSNKINFIIIVTACNVHRMTHWPLVVCSCMVALCCFPVLFTVAFVLVS